MFFEETGKENSQTIVFIHGGGVAGWSFAMQKSAFAAYHCLFVDLPAHGQSGGTFSMDASIEGVIDLIETYAHNGRAILVGHSIGAKIALGVLVKRPELIIKAAICSAAYSSSALMHLLASKRMNQLSLSMLQSPAVVDMQTRQFRFPTKEMEEHFRDELKHTKLETLVAVGQEMLRFSSAPVGLENIQVPVLILTGNREIRQMRNSALALAQRIPQSRYVEIECAQHNYPWAQYARFNQLLNEFIAQ